MITIATLETMPAAAQEPATPSRDVVVVRRCEIEYKRSSMVGVGHMGSTMTTVLQDCLVHLGDRVKAGQVLGRIMDGDIRAELALRTAEAENLLDVRISETKVDQAANRLKRTEKLQKRDVSYVPAEEKVSQELEMNAAKLLVEESKYELRLAELKRSQAEALLHAREYVSPHDGVVVEIVKEQGEAVSINEPNFRVVDVDRLKVTGYLNLGDYWRVRPGQEVRIVPEIDGEELPIEREVFAGRVVFVDRRIDPANRTCKVVAEVANRDLLLASGLEARMEIVLDPPSSREQITEPSQSAPARIQTQPASRLEPGGKTPELSTDRPAGVIAR
jgi:multidrug efflux pump subunit AcrA (membrane-fusion protein)